MPSTYELYKAMAVLPKGATLFSLAFSKKAPYFATIKPHVTEMRPNFASLTLPKRKAVQNHIDPMGDLGIGQTLGRQQHDPSTLSQTGPNSRGPNPRGQDVIIAVAEHQSRSRRMSRNPLSQTTTV